MAAGDVKVRSAGIGDFSISNARIKRLFERAPRVTFAHLRDTLGSIFGSHRREWLAATRVDFSERRGLRAGRMNSQEGTPGGFAGRRTFHYKIFPKSKRAPKGVRPDIESISGEAFTSSRVALGLEKGGRFTGKSGKIAIPIGVTLDSLGRPKSKWATPRLFKKAAAKNKLVAFATSPGASVILWQAKQKGRGKNKRTVHLPAYMLVDKVTRSPRLKFVTKWEELAGDRQSRLKRMLDRIVEDVSRGKS